MPYPEDYKKLKEQADRETIEKKVGARKGLEERIMNHLFPKWLDMIEKGTPPPDGSVNAARVMLPYIASKMPQKTEVDMKADIASRKYPKEMEEEAILAAAEEIQRRSTDGIEE